MTTNGDQAREFFEQLDEFSRRYVAAELNLDSATSPWGSKQYDTNTPHGAVLHFTADEDLLRVLRWFLIESHKAKASSHAVIADRRLASQDELAHDLPLIQELPATVVQVRHPHTVAWHATWTNGTCYGIENVNAGPLKKVEPSTEGQPDSFTSWRPRDRSAPEWTAPWKVPYKRAVQLYGRWWAPYTPEQIHANVIVLRYVQQLFGTLRRSWILGHEIAQANKADPGPTFPLAGIREAVFDDWKPVERYDWFRLYSADQLYGQTLRDGIVIEYAKHAGSENPNPAPGAAWTRFQSAVQALPDKDEFGLVGKTALRLLGYHVSDLMDASLDTDESMSVWVFQKMMGLKTDSKPGPATKRALIERLKDRGLLEAHHDGRVAQT